MALVKKQTSRFKGSLSGEFINTKNKKMSFANFNVIVLGIFQISF